MHRITAQIRREFFREIVAGRKRVEYREIKPYWTRKLDGLKVPFDLRLINGMLRPIPEATVRIDRVRRDSRRGRFELHIGKVLGVQSWDRRREQPRR